MPALAPMPTTTGPGGQYRGNAEAHTFRTHAAINEASTVITKELNMTTKIVTLRVPSPLYAGLCQTAGELGVPVSAHIRRLIEREHDALQLAALRSELLSRLDRLAVPTQPAPSQQGQAEMLLLCRAVATHLNPQLVAQVRAQLTLGR